jgi:hypothetical protein
MFPGVSSEDCLFADLGIDPGHRGCQSFEATDFLLRHRRSDPSSHLVLWQAAAIAVPDYRRSDYWNPRGTEVLARELSKLYGTGHELVVYEAAVYPVGKSRCEVVSIGSLPSAKLSLTSTLYVPPLSDRALDLELLSELTEPESREVAKAAC